MIKQKLASIIFILFLSLNLFGQGEEIQVSVIDEGVSDVTYYLYDPPYKAKSIYKNKEEALNLTPESLASSIMSTTNQEWVDYNQYGGKGPIKKPDYFEIIKKGDESTYSSLIAKLSFNYEGKKYALVKFRLHLEELQEAGIAGCHLFVYDNNRWHKTDSLKNYGWLVMTLSEINPIALQSVLRQDKSRSPHVKNFLDKISIKNKISLKLLITEYSNMSYDNSRSNAYKYFSEDMGW